MIHYHLTRGLLSKHLIGQFQLFARHAMDEAGFSVKRRTLFYATQPYLNAIAPWERIIKITGPPGEQDGVIGTRSSRIHDNSNIAPHLTLCSGPKTMLCIRMHHKSS
jgi:hypothetical protein